MRSVVEIGASVPAFLEKLWKIINDTETNHLISWSPSGTTFVIKHQADFERELLPLYYKHNKMASFIRQLNMYGFHKITSVENGGLRYDKDEIEFSHPYFKKSHEYLLKYIKRKIANPKSIVTSNESEEKRLLKPELMKKVLTDVKQMKSKQESLDAKFSAMNQENEALWREVAILRQKHMKLQQIVNNLIQFLMSLVQPTRLPNGNNVGVKRPYQLVTNNAAHDAHGSYPGRLKNMKLEKNTLLDELSEDNLEDRHELAHDDLMHSEAGSEFVLDDIASMTNANTGHCPGDHATSMYHHTMKDGDNTDAAGNILGYPIYHHHGGQKTTDNFPIITSTSPTSTTPTLDQPSMNEVMDSPSPVVVKIEHVPTKQKGCNNSANRSTVPSSYKGLSSGNYNTLNPPSDLKHPAEIFATDDSVSDAEVVATDEISMKNALQDVLDEALLTTPRDKLLGINIKIERPELKASRKSKKGNKSTETILNVGDIKTEIQDDIEWNNMTLATVNNNNNRFQTRH